ncbi:myb-like domain, Myb/SANT-like DNA-binding domain protein [Artemisia annua]|uniref:Myb-like domain, Myb/SANT-like DNA-binding domain protein n=1 Tax=Artemisia annua TaxID=35608 RepID=A0A2U1M8E7_ARTAN|nr:myb-like domain, Myb/SANT-like DNA-binding domain protein [Artemisia annua]
MASDDDIRAFVMHIHNHNQEGGYSSGHGKTTGRLWYRAGTPPPVTRYRTPKRIRDPRKLNRVARGASRPRAQTQPDYYPQSSSQSQAGYRLQFLEAQSPPLFYPQQPLPQLPTHFDPFEPRYTQQKRRKRESGPLPVRDDSDDDEDYDHVNMVLETQLINEEAVQHEEVEEAEVPRQSQRKPAKIWTPDEEEALTKAWIKISVDKEVRLKDSGCNDLQVYERAQLDFEKQFRKAFAHTKAWRIVKDQAKWKAQASVSLTQESTRSSKKRKSSESSSAQTPTSETPINVEDFDCDLPNLNENPTPSRQSRGKKKANSEESNRSSMRDTLASYTAEKQSLLQAQLEVQKKKDAEYFKFLDGEVINSDMKFVMEPHDNIPDRAFKEFVINKKREICAQHGWPCSL